MTFFAKHKTIRGFFDFQELYSLTTSAESADFCLLLRFIFLIVNAIDVHRSDGDVLYYYFVFLCHIRLQIYYFPTNIVCKIRKCYTFCLLFFYTCQRNLSLLSRRYCTLPSLINRQPVAIDRLAITYKHKAG